MGHGLKTVLAYDIGDGIGLGHLRRTESLASAFEACGVIVDHRPLDGTVVGDLVVIDSYRERADDHAVASGHRVVALDDLRRDLDVDLVVDPSPGASPAPHVRARSVLAGARFAVVDPSLRDLPRTPITATPTSVLVTVGGSDPDSLLPRLVDAVVEQVSPAVEVLAAVGPWHATAPRRATVVHTADGLGPHLAAADVVVTAGGVTLLEALALGRPTVALTLAENQRQAVDSVIRAGAAVLGHHADPEATAGVVAALLGTSDRRRALAAAARTMVDGRGADRVADAAITLMDDSLPIGRQR